MGQSMSALPPKADIRPPAQNIRFVPIADIGKPPKNVFMSSRSNNGPLPKPRAEAKKKPGRKGRAGRGMGTGSLPGVGARGAVSDRVSDADVGDARAAGIAGDRAITASQSSIDGVVASGAIDDTVRSR